MDSGQIQAKQAKHDDQELQLVLGRLGLVRALSRLVHRLDRSESIGSLLLDERAEANANQTQCDTRERNLSPHFADQSRQQQQQLIQVQENASK